MPDIDRYVQAAVAATAARSSVEPTRRCPGAMRRPPLTALAQPHAHDGPEYASLAGAPELRLTEGGRTTPPHRQPRTTEGGRAD